jgi:hypothetical protein
VCSGPKSTVASFALEPIPANAKFCWGGARRAGASGEHCPRSGRGAACSTFPFSATSDKQTEQPHAGRAGCRICRRTGLRRFAGGRYASEARTPLQEGRRIAELAGFGLQQIAVIGHHSAPGAPIFNALDLAIARSLLHFNAAVARERIDVIPARSKGAPPRSNSAALCRGRVLAEAAELVALVARGSRIASERLWRRGIRLGSVVVAAGV